MTQPSPLPSDSETSLSTAGTVPPLPPEPTPSSVIRLAIPMGQARVMYILLALNIAIFVIPTIYELIGGTLFGLPAYEAVLRIGAKQNQAIYQDGQIYRFLTAMFLHASVPHILFNAWALYSLGGDTERLYGTGRFLVLYMIAGFAGGLASYALSPRASVGASGAIFGLIGAIGAFYFASRSVLGETANQQLGNLSTILLINLFIGFSTPLIDNYAHLGGFVGGAIAGWFLAPRVIVERNLVGLPEARRQYPAMSWPAAMILILVMIGLFQIIVPPQ